MHYSDARALIWPMGPLCPLLPSAPAPQTKEGSVAGPVAAACIMPGDLRAQPTRLHLVSRRGQQFRVKVFPGFSPPLNPEMYPDLYPNRIYI